MNAKYTMTLEDVLKVYHLTALDKYPIHSESARQDLNNFIINEFSTYEIGCETIEMFDSRLYARLLKIMYKYDYLLELYSEIKRITIAKLLENRYDTYESNISDYDGSSKKTGDDNFTHGHIVDYEQALTTDTNNKYNSDTDNVYGSTQTTDDDRFITQTNTQLGGTNKTESANLIADTPQNNSPVSDKVGGDAFDSFDNSVFAINGYLTKADKNLTINERHDSDKSETSTDGDLVVTKAGKDSNQHRGTDTTYTLQGGNSHTTNRGTDVTTYNNLTTDKNKTDTKKHLNGNSDYIKSIDDIQNTINNIYQQIATDLKPVFLGVF